jgi:cytochrome c oxidase accessory protein FixG
MEFFTGNMTSWEVFWVFFYAFATYGNAGFMREQVCKYMCPYARFQSAMFDKDTLIVTYDEERGEPRGARSKKADPKALGLGSCVDCSLCVQVCPTGIDIRKGLQYECIGCGACADFCDTVMEKVGYPKGLIKYSTQNAMAGGWSREQTWRRVLRPRVLLYTGILLVVTLALLSSLALRKPFKVDVVRDRAALARIVSGGQIENVYRLQVMNATESAQRYKVTASGLEGIKVSMKDAQVELQSTEARWVVVSLQIPPQVAMKLQDQQPDVVQKVHIKVEQVTGEQAGASVEEKTTFLLPK